MSSERPIAELSYVSPSMAGSACKLFAQTVAVQPGNPKRISGSVVNLLDGLAKATAPSKCEAVAIRLEGGKGREGKGMRSADSQPELGSKLGTSPLASAVRLRV